MITRTSHQTTGQLLLSLLSAEIESVRTLFLQPKVSPALDFTPCPVW
jgi:hypothetical protein